MKKTLILIGALSLVITLVLAGSGLTWMNKWYDNVGGDSTMIEYDEVAFGNELIQLYSHYGEVEFGKTIWADDGDMSKAEWAYLEGPYQEKFEEVEWNGVWIEDCDPHFERVNAFVNKVTDTADLHQQGGVDVSIALRGSDTMEVTSDNYIEEAGNVVIWGSCGDFPGLLEVPAVNKLVKPPLPPHPPMDP